MSGADPGGASPSARDRLDGALVGLGAGLAWGAAHVVVHRPRGWPMEVHGEWDLLLTALAIAGGRAPDGVVGTLHGNELGSYVVAALVAPPIALGMDPVAAAKWAAAGFGAVAAACVALVARRVAVDAGASRLSASHAGVLAGAWTAAAWPGLHFELAGLSGRTPEALAPTLLAVLLLAAPAIRPFRAALAGVLLGGAWLLSPVTLWTAGLAAALALPRMVGWRPLGALLLGALAPLPLFGALVPAGWEAVGAFLVEQVGLGVVEGAGTHARPGLALVGHIPGAFEGGAHFPLLTLRAWPLALLGGLAVAGPVPSIVRAVRRRDPRDPAAFLAVLALSWLLPLAALPEDVWFYPLAFRYWLVLLALGLALVCAEVVVARRRFGIPAGVLLVALVAVCGTTLPTSIIAPAPSRAEALVLSGAHRTNARPGRDRQAIYLALRDGVSGVDAAAFAEGFGLALGGDLAVDARDGRELAAPWQHPALPGGGSVRAALLAGIGCGVTMAGPGPVPEPARALIEAAVEPDRGALLWGVQRCATPGPYAPPFAPSTVADPRSLAPPRW